MARSRRVALSAVRAGPCTVCGRQVERNFSLRVGWGLSRTYEQALALANAQIAAWYATPHRHRKCEPPIIVGRQVAGEHVASLVRPGGVVTRPDGFVRRRVE